MAEHEMAEHEVASPHESTQPHHHMPRGGAWLVFACLSIACILAIVIVPATWKMPLGIVSMAFLALSIAALALSGRRSPEERQRSP
jgi:hypothetical protein